MATAKGQFMVECWTLDDDGCEIGGPLSQDGQSCGYGSKPKGLFTREDAEAWAESWRGHGWRTRIHEVESAAGLAAVCPHCGTKVMPTEYALCPLCGCGPI